MAGKTAQSLYLMEYAEATTYSGQIKNKIISLFE